MINAPMPLASTSAQRSVDACSRSSSADSTVASTVASTGLSIVIAVNSATGISCRPNIAAALEHSNNSPRNS